MNPKPKQLALLISLIGVGVSPGAWARSELRVIGAPPSSQDLVVDSSVATTLVEGSALSIDPSIDPVGLPRSNALETIRASAGWLLYAAPGDDDWAPGESPDWIGDRVTREFVEPAAAPVAGSETASSEVSEPPRQPNRKKHSGTTRRVRVLVLAPPAPVEVLATIDARGVERIAPVQVVPALATAAPAHAERLLESLAEVVRDAPVIDEASGQEPAARVDAALPAEPDVARIREVSAPRLDRVEFTVDTESSKVLGLLGAILSGERDEVGAVKADTGNVVVTTQSDKVRAMLGEISSAHRPQEEDGPARRARKLAAAAALQAEAERTKSDEVVEVAEARSVPERVDGDVTLSLELPVSGRSDAADSVPRPSLDSAAMPTITVQAEPRVRPSPFGDQQLAVSEKLLDGVRGGFGVDGLNISFGIQRAVYINGVLVTTTSLNLSEMGRITAGSGTTSFNAGTIALVQSGAGNLVSTGVLASGAIGTVIQNTLDGQKIQNMTVINASANSVSALRGLNLESSMRSAVLDSLRR